MQGDKKTFKISMVDDTPGALGSELDDIEEYLERRYELKLELDRYEKAPELIAKIDPTTDIAFIDKNLNGVSGIDVIGDIRDKYKLLDILIYSRANIESEDQAKINNYGIVETAHKKEQIVDKLKTLIDKNLSKWEDIVFLRGSVISRIVELEMDINDALMETFSPPGEADRKKFRDFFLENSAITLEAKKEILRKMTKGTDRPFSVKDLDDLQRYRNKLAHCKRSETNPNVLITMGEGLEVGRAEIKEIFKKADRFSGHIKTFR